MSGLLVLVQHTPWWAFVLLAVLIGLGVQARRPRSVAIWRVLVVPAVFVAWGVISLAQKAAGSPPLALDWLLTAVAGGAIAVLATRFHRVHIDRAAGAVRVPGSIVPLARNLAIFAAKYALTAAMTLAPALQATLAPWDLGISGLSAGYFAGWIVRFALKYRAARQPEAAIV